MLIDKMKKGSFQIKLTCYNATGTIYYKVESASLKLRAIKNLLTEEIKN